LGEKMGKNNECVFDVVIFMSKTNEASLQMFHYYPIYRKVLITTKNIRVNQKLNHQKLESSCCFTVKHPISKEKAKRPKHTHLVLSIFSLLLLTAKLPFALAINLT
jgi:ribosomal protein S17